jgi:acetate kinase
MSDELIVTVNAGSSSIKFAIFSAMESPQRILDGQVERIGDPDPQLVTKHKDTGAEERLSIEAKTFEQAATSVAKFVLQRFAVEDVAAIGHRVVHGGLRLLEHQLITTDVAAELRQAQELDITHLPREIALIEAFSTSFPGRRQVACFDTAFHRDLPLVSRLLPIPRRFLDAGIRRLGFHGLSYTYLMQQLATIAGPEAARGRVVLAHLGSGASMAAVRGGKPVETTMAFTPIAGLVMGTRPGDLDPGLLVYLARQQRMSAEEMDEFISHRCGLLGVSDTSADVRDLLAARAADQRAAEAIALFCYQAKKQLCSLAGALGGLDTVVFAGGIGEHAPEIRGEICEGLGFLGLSLDSAANAGGSDVVSTAQSRVTARIIPTDEEIVMARIVRSIVDHSK